MTSDEDLIRSRLSNLLIKEFRLSPVEQLERVYADIELIYRKQKEEALRLQREEYKSKIKKLELQIDKYDNFILAVEQNTDDWDELCNCECFKGVHDEDCMTSLVRLDVSRLKGGKE
jgi:hypothetical protein